MNLMTLLADDETMSSEELRLSRLVSISRKMFSCGAMWRVLVQSGSHATEKNLSRAGPEVGLGEIIDPLPRRAFLDNFLLSDHPSGSSSLASFDQVAISVARERRESRILSCSHNGGAFPSLLGHRTLAPKAESLLQAHEPGYGSAETQLLLKLLAGIVAQNPTADRVL